ncbi:glycosyltransferase [Paenibacillus elgii]|uniref:glycosyltransferase n=1 Tax=Paenibacillus elgii TaxID=189691 RepID=UPI0013D89ACA|nr:glycosyltransferase family 2 protein [Paenibacillus elgii]
MFEPHLSLCMIARNEADNIERCIRSALTVAEEIIIVDTGSQDDTVERCIALGARVIEHPWNDNFAEARNKGIEIASGKWVLWMDADEELDASAAQLIREVSMHTEEDILYLQVINYYGESRHHAHPAQAHLAAQARLFRNGKGIYFSGAIHETLQCAPGGLLPSHPLVLPVRIYHYGYMEDRIKEKQKNVRNLKILEKQKKLHESDPWLEYHLASEYNRQKRYEEAFQHVNLAIAGFLSHRRLPPSLVYKLKFEILFNDGSMAGAWPGIELALQLYPDYVDLHFYKGIFLMKNKFYVEAVSVFDHCLEIGENAWKHLTLRGVGSFLALECLAQCMEGLEKPGAAAVYRNLSHESRMTAA